MPSRRLALAVKHESAPCRWGLYAVVLYAQCIDIAVVVEDGDARERPPSEANHAGGPGGPLSHNQAQPPLCVHSLRHLLPRQPGLPPDHGGDGTAACEPPLPSQVMTDWHGCVGLETCWGRILTIVLNAIMIQQPWMTLQLTRCDEVRACIP